MKTLAAYLAVPHVRQGSLVLLAALAALAYVQIEWRGPLTREHAAAETRFKAMQQDVAELSARISIQQ